jgi:hypothetical protein
MTGMFLWLMSPIAEILISVTLDRLAPPGTRWPKQLRADVSRSWYGIVALHSSFLLVSSIAIGILQILTAWQDPFGDSMESQVMMPVLFTIGSVSLIVLPLWWWFNLGVCIVKRARTGPAAALGILSIPVMIAGCVFLTGLCCGLLL